MADRRRFPISGTTRERAVAAAVDLASRIRANPDVPVEQFVEAAWRQTRTGPRWILSGADTAEVLAAIDRFVFEDLHEAAGTPRLQAPRVTLVFSGMGPQWPGMGRELYQADERFRAHIDRVDAVFCSLAGWSPWDAVIRLDPGDPVPTELAQPSNFALQAALHHLLEDEGIYADTVLGHSAGEVAAAYAAGVYSLEDACRVSLARGTHQGTLAGSGSMLAVGLDEASASAWIEGTPSVSIAAVNDRSSVTLAGDAGELERLAAGFADGGVFAKALRVEVPYHSPAMDPILDAVVSELQPIAPRAPRLPLYSTVSAALTDAETWAASYWARNIRQTVQFAATIEQALADGSNCFIEVSPHPVLSTNVSDLAAGTPTVVVSLLNRRDDESKTFRSALASLAIERVGRPIRTASAPLPPPDWERTVHWDEDPTAAAERRGDPALPDAPLLGRQVAGPAPAFETTLSLADQPWVGGHVVEGLGPVVPAALWLDLLCLGAGGGNGACTLAEIVISQALVLTRQDTVLRISRTPSEVLVHARIGGDRTAWTLHASARVLDADGGSAGAPPHLHVSGELTDIATDALYRRFAFKGLHYDDPFRPLTEVRVGPGVAQARIESERPYGDGMVSPWLVDAGLQLLLAASTDHSEAMFLPARIDRLRIRPGLRGATALHAVAKLRADDRQAKVGDVDLCDSDGAVVAEIRGVACVQNQADGAALDQHVDRHTYRLAYEVAETDVTTEAEEPAHVPTRVWDERFPPGAAWRTALADHISSVGPVNSQESKSCDRHHFLVVPAAPDPTEVHRLTVVLQALSEEPQVKAVTCVAPVGTGWLAGVRRSAENALRLPIRIIEIDDASSFAGHVGLLDDLRDREVRINADGLHNNRLRPVPSRSALWPRPASHQLQAEVLGLRPRRGRLDGFQLVGGCRKPPTGREVEVELGPVAIGWKDVGKVLGTINLEAELGALSGSDPGLAAAGHVVRTGPDAAFAPGDRVLGTIRRPLRTAVTVDPDSVFLQAVPDDVDLSIAACNLVPWMTTLAVCDDLLRVRSRDTVFVQSGAGGLGLVVCQYLARAGVRVVTSVGDPQKAELVLARVPGATVVVGRGASLAESVRCLGLRFDAIITSASGAVRDDLLDQLAWGGHLVDIGRAARAGEPVARRALDANRTLSTFDLDHLGVMDPDRFRSLAERALSQIAEPGAAAPVHISDRDGLGAALTRLAQGETTGALGVDVSLGQLRRPDAMEVELQPGAYVVTGGTGAVGTTVAQWLVSRGARDVWLVSRSGVPPAEHAAVFDVLRTTGARIRSVAADVTDREGVASLAAELDADGLPVRGIVHAAGVVSDGPFADIDLARVRASFDAKVLGAELLLDALKSPDLDFMILTSSVSAVLGFSIQATYASANAALDAWCEQQRAAAIPAVAVQMGPVEGRGMAGDDDVQRYFAALGLTALSPRHLFGILDRAAAATVSNFMVCQVDWRRVVRSETQMTSSSLIRDLVAEAQLGAEGNELDELRLLDPAARAEVLTQLLGVVIGQVLALEDEQIHADTPIQSLGIDSLGTMEVQTAVNEILAEEIPVSRLVAADDTVADLARRISSHLDDGADRG